MVLWAMSGLPVSAADGPAGAELADPSEAVEATRRTGEKVDLPPEDGRYQGEWKEGRRHGWGIFMHPDGYRYEGYWENDLPHGNGTARDADGDR